MTNSCDGCKWGLLVDEGYSNYTAEGATFHCLKKLHPHAPFDQFYGEDKRLAFADTCGGFMSGEPVSIDVDRDDQKDGDPLSVAYTKDKEVAALLDAWEKAE